MVASDDQAKQNPNVELANTIYRAEQSQKRGEDIEIMKCAILDDIRKDNMNLLYVQVCERLKWVKDEGLFSEMEAVNAKKLLELEDKIKDAAENSGDTEVSIIFI